MFPFEDVVSSNLRLQPGRNGRLHNAPRYARALKRLHDKARQQVDGTPRPTAGRAWRVEIVVSPPDRRRRDITNLIKIVLDALEGIVYEDDVMVHDCRITLASASTRAGHVAVRARQMETQSG
jgi:Holliday junction resolvase RusA-like endonuclease